VPSNSDYNPSWSVSDIARRAIDFLFEAFRKKKKSLRGQRMDEQVKLEDDSDTVWDSALLLS
jgi:hypothetical protein